MIYILKFAAGLSCLFFGMQLMRNGLEEIAQKRIRKALYFLTKTPTLGAITGLLLTILVQSSTAVTVITISLVNANIINFSNAVGIVLGTNVGTSITAQLMSLNLETLAIPSIGLGAILFFLPKKSAIRSVGKAIIGFGLVFLGMATMAHAMEPLKNSADFIKYLTIMSKNPIWGVLAGTIFTALIHSSSTTTGVVIALSFQGLIDLQSAIAIVLGSNIGTCITAVLASIGGNRGAKQVAAAHVLLNILGVLAFLPILLPFTQLISLTDTQLPRQIANAHTIFNIISSLIVLPFAAPFAKIVKKIVPD